MTAGPRSPSAPDARLGPELERRLVAARADKGVRDAIAEEIDPDDVWHPEIPVKVHPFAHWPGRIRDRAHDAVSRSRLLKLRICVQPGDLRYHYPPADGGNVSDGLLERQRRYCYIAIALLLTLHVTAAEMARREGFDFKSRRMLDTLKGVIVGDAGLRRQYMQALLCEALEQGYTPSQILVWLQSWGPPLGNPDPVLYIDERGVPRCHVLAVDAARGRPRLGTR